MINKRLIGTVPDSKPYIAGNVALQWLSLLSNAGMIFSCAWFLQQLLEGAAAPRTLALPLAAGLAAVLVRGICTVGAGRMSFLAARSVKRTLRRSIYEKLLRLGPAYSQNVATSEAVQLAAEGVEQLETYFGAYLPQFFYSMLAPATLFALLAPVSLRAALALLVCVPLIPAAIAAVQTFAKKLLGRYWGQYTALGDTFLENLQGLTTLKIYQADGYKQEEMNREAEKFRRITMKVLTMQLNSITIMDLVAYGGAALGKVICDAYYEGCEAVETQDSATLSVTDLTKIQGLLDAYEEFGAQALSAAAQDPGFLSRFSRAAAGTENYGGNTREQGYTNMVDLGGIARHTADTLPGAQAVLDALDECVLYQVNGKYRSEGTGLSCYYSYSGDVDDLNGYIQQGAGAAFKYLYAYQLTGQLDQDGMDYIAQLGVDTLAPVESLSTMGWNNAPLTLSDDGYATLTLGPEADSILAGIGFSLYWLDEENDAMLLLGTDNDMTCDWESGVFSDNFRGVWGSIDGHLVYMELSSEGEDYNLYSVPVLLNGEAYNLQVVYDFTDEEWRILGARQGIDDSGMADKELRLLKPGDEITTVWYLSDWSEDSGFEAYESETLTVTADTAFYEQSLPDGSYLMIFEMRDSQGNSAYSQGVGFTVDGEDITTSVYE